MHRWRGNEDIRLPRGDEESRGSPYTDRPYGSRSSALLLSTSGLCCGCMTSTAIMARSLEETKLSRVGIEVGKQSVYYGYNTAYA